MASEGLTPSEVAREFNVSPTTVRRWEKRGWLEPTSRTPGSRHRRYAREAVDAFKLRVEAGEFDNPTTPPAAAPPSDS